LSMWWFSRRSSISVTMRDMVSSISGGGDRCSSALDRTRFEVCLTFLLLVFSNSYSRFGHFLLIHKIELFD
jgi:hypothetical protein